MYWSDCMTKCIWHSLQKHDCPYTYQAYQNVIRLIMCVSQNTMLLSVSNAESNPVGSIDFPHAGRAPITRQSWKRTPQAAFGRWRTVRATKLLIS